MDYVKADEVAREFKVARSTVYEWARDPEAVRMGAVIWMSERIVRFDLDKMAAWLRNRSLRMRGLVNRPGRPRKGGVVA